MTEIERRVEATQKTLDKYKDLTFEWGTNDCAKMAVTHLRNMGKTFPIAKAGTYKTALAAKAALKKLGFSNLIEAADSQFQRVPPASAVVGDLMALPAEDDFGAITVVIGNGRVAGFSQETGTFVVAQPFKEALDQVIAWRVL